MDKKDNFYLIILSLVLMMFRVGENSIISTSSLVAPFLYINDLMMDVYRLLYQVDSILAFIGVLLFFYSSINLLLKLFRENRS